MCLVGQSSLRDVHIFVPETKNRTLVSETDYLNPRLAASCVIPYPRLRDAQQFSHTIQGKQRYRLCGQHLHRILLSELLPFRNHMFLTATFYGLPTTQTQ
jgi:hypothetical protein